MSNIYIQEPPTTGKVIVTTDLGDIDIELWTREAPKACRNFIQLCLEGYYDDTVFHRIVKGFIVQGGDPTGTGEGGESIYGEPFKDEFHTRLRFVRRGLVAMANAGKNDNASQFFFTLAATPELQNKNTIFGKITGETIYNMLKLEDALVDANDRPIYPPKIIKTEVINNPFTDIVPRVLPKSKTDDKPKKEKKKGVKDFKLLSFGEEAEEDEEETLKVSKKLSSKSKSAHDVLDDPKLSTQSVSDALAQESEIERPKIISEDAIEGDQSESEHVDDSDEDKREEKLDGVARKIKEKLSSSKSSSKSGLEKRKLDSKANEDSDEEEYYLGKDRDDEKKRRLEEIRKEYRGLQKEIKKERDSKLEDEKKKVEEEKKKEKTSKVLEEYHKTQETFKKALEKNPKKGPSREQFTIQLLAKFKSKIKNVTPAEDEEEVPEPEGDEEEEKMLKDGSWMAHVLKCEEKGPILAKDANTKADDWFEIYDPRNPLNKRRRGEGKAGKSENEKKK